MATNKLQTGMFIETSALIPMLESENGLQKRILEHIRKRKALVGIDTIVLSEFMAGLKETTDKVKVMEGMSKQFRIHTFDAHTALVCAEIFKTLKEKGQIPKKKSKRQITKADIMIMASAIVSGATELIFEDGDFANYHRYLPNEIYGHKVPVFTKASKLPPEIVQEELGI